LLIAVSLVFLPAPRTEAQMMAPQPFGMPVAAEWRAPLAQFLADFGIPDVGATVDASRAMLYPRGPSESGPDFIIFRLIHPSTCDDRDKCITVIGHIEQGKLIADLMFNGGGKMNAGDVALRMPGVNGSIPVFFHSEDSTVTVINTAKGLLISSEPVSPAAVKR
jgi:hypothetical protein